MMEKKVTALQLKAVAAGTMLMDHIGAVLILEVVRSQKDPARFEVWKFVYWYIRGIGRMAFPLFVFLLVEGFFHTRSRLKYLGRLILFGILSEVPFDLAVKLKVQQISAGQFLEYSGQNVMFTLAIGFFCMWVMEELLFTAPDDTGFLKRTGRVYLPCVLVILSGSILGEYFSVDYGWGGVLAISMAYLFRKFQDRKAGFAAQIMVLCVYSAFECVALLDYFLITRYDGEKGRAGFKWFFYVFYPVHLFILGLMRYFWFR